MAGQNDAARPREAADAVCARAPWLADAERVDRALYEAVARTSTPSLDLAMRRLSQAANYSRLSIASSAVLATFGRRQGRLAAASGLASVAATSAAVNLVIKPLARRRRPEPGTELAPDRGLEMPTSRSFPSGHTAAAVAFASGVAPWNPVAALPLHGLALLVGYSRVHTGVHYPGDVMAGALIGAVIGDVTAYILDRRWG